MFSTIKKMKKCEVDFQERRMLSKARKQEQSWDFRYDCKNFAGIAKISLGL